MKEPISIVLACSWVPPPSVSLHDRMRRVAETLASVPLVRHLGPTWYELGRSRRDALKRPVALERFATPSKPWARSTVGDADAPKSIWWSIHVWNGGEDAIDLANTGTAASLGVQLMDPKSAPSWNPNLDVSRVTIGARFGHVASCVSWAELVDSMRTLATSLGGRTDLFSSELREVMRQADPNCPDAFYGVCWGIDASGTSPLYENEKGVRVRAPSESFVCTSWGEVRAPPLDRIRALAREIASGCKYR